MKNKGNNKSCFCAKAEIIKQCHSRGFTLIELLVVVLIIGILAAVALPQYNKAVEKSRAAEAWTMLKAIDNAMHVYRLEHGEEPNSFVDLDISFVDKDGNAPTGKWLYTKDFEYYLGTSDWPVCPGTNYHPAIATRNDKKSVLQYCGGKRYCAHEGAGNVAWCNSLGFKTALDSSVGSCLSGETCYME